VTRTTNRIRFSQVAVLVAAMLAVVGVVSWSAAGGDSGRGGTHHGAVNLVSSSGATHASGGPLTQHTFSGMPGPIRPVPPLPTNPPDAFVTGIRTGDCEAPMPTVDFVCTSFWQDVVAGDRYRVYAGTAGTDDPNTGRILVLKVGTSGVPDGTKIPGAGWLKITAADPNTGTLDLQSESGSTYVFNVLTGQTSPNPSP
jgi:hypothetical protein